MFSPVQKPPNEQEALDWKNNKWIRVGEGDKFMDGKELKHVPAAAARVLPRQAAGAGVRKETEGPPRQGQGGLRRSDSKRRGGEGQEPGRTCWNWGQRIPFWHRADGKQKAPIQVKSTLLTSFGKRPREDKELLKKEKKASKKMHCWLEGQH